MTRTATFSEDRLYRYTLERIWDEDKPYCQFIGLNCSTADETLDDPTVRRCIRFAEDWGYGGLIMTNLFAFRATDPKVMRAHYESLTDFNRMCVIRDNFNHVTEVAEGAGITVAAWGVHGSLFDTDKALRLELSASFIKLHHLGLTKGGHPKHPLYLRADTKPKIWRDAK